VFVGPDGRVERSMVKAWEAHKRSTAEGQQEGVGEEKDEKQQQEEKRQQQEEKQQEEKQQEEECDDDEPGDALEEVVSLVAVAIDPREANPGVDRRCGICLDDCLDGTQTASQADGSWGRTVCCQAKFHHQCLVQWLRQSEYANVCPQCRTKQKSMSSRRLLALSGE